MPLSSCYNCTEVIEAVSDDCGTFIKVQCLVGRGRGVF